MKRNTLAIIFACCTLALLAQDAIRVKYQGAKPTISDLAWAFLNAIDNEEEECGDKPSNAILNAWTQQREGLPLMEGETLTIDEKNGYVLYEFHYDSHILKMEMCYWNEADGKHKLFAFNNMASINLDDGKPILTETSGLNFWRYDNATKKMTYCDPPGFEVEYFDTAYALPCSGKNITVVKWNEDGTKTEKTLKWDGHKFSY
ncbi:MAG: hypothetical protein J5565_04580 [Muribaculaceae bacterium]|nr:hypothetical protein [Muribaculaceae bacterium]